MTEKLALRNKKTKLILAKDLLHSLADDFITCRADFRIESIFVLFSNLNKLYIILCLFRRVLYSKVNR
jgi:hypothetical protein